MLCITLVIFMEAIIIFYHDLSLIGSVVLVLLPCFVYLHPIFLIDGHLRMLDKVLFYQISVLSLNPFEAAFDMAWSNEITRQLWEIVQDNDTTTREKTNALSCLTQSYNSRLQTLTAGPESFMNIKKSLSESDL